MIVTENYSVRCAVCKSVHYAVVRWFVWCYRENWLVAWRQVQSGSYWRIFPYHRWNWKVCVVVIIVVVTDSYLAGITDILLVASKWSTS